MGIFNKIFGNKSKPGNPDNTKLLELLDIYWKNNRTGRDYENVMLELMNGNSFLLFPTKNDSKTDSDKWTTAATDKTLRLAQHPIKRFNH